MGVTSDRRVRRGLDVIVVGAVVVALLHLVWKAGGGDIRHNDFVWLWLAGRVWWSAGDPYGPQYFAAMSTLFPPGTWTGAAWVYPPNWWPVAVLLGLPDIRTGFALWNTLNVCFIGAGLALWGRAAVAFGRPLPWRRQSALLVFISFLTGTGSAFGVGQTGFLIFAGVGLLAYAIAKGNTVWGAVAVAVLTLKPQFGLVVLMTMAVERRLWKMAALGLLLAGVAAVPGVWSVGPLQTLREWQVNLGHYRDIPYNLPAAMTGIGRLLAGANYQASATGLTLLAGAVSAIVYSLAVRRAEKSGGAVQRFRSFFLVTLACVACFVGLHIYDLIVVSPLLLFVPTLRRVPALVGAAGLVLMLRPENLANALGPRMGLDAPLLVAVGGVCLFAAALSETLVDDRTRSSHGGSGTSRSAALS